MQIEKDVAPPAPSGPRAKYPYGRMEVGDSVYIKGATIPGREYAAAMQNGERNGKQFTGRKVEGGIRIWRIE